jgi:NADH-quinone oxidoreductase subunit J
MFIMAALGGATILSALVAVLHTHLIRAVVAFAVSSISLAAIFFLLAAPFAGAFELTVGAGLVAVLFLVALILAGGEENEVAA